MTKMSPFVVEQAVIATGLLGWFGWFLTFCVFLGENSSIWIAMGDGPSNHYQQILSTLPVLETSAILLGVAVASTLYREHQLEADVKRYGTWVRETYDRDWFRKYYGTFAVAELFFLFFGWLNILPACLAPCSSPGWAVIFVFESLLLPGTVGAAGVLLYLFKGRGLSVPIGCIALLGVGLFLWWIVIGLAAPP